MFGRNPANTPARRLLQAGDDVGVDEADFTLRRPAHPFLAFRLHHAG